MDTQAGHAEDPQSLNRYPYALNDPINRVDPRGTDPGLVGPPSNGYCSMAIVITGVVLIPSGAVIVYDVSLVATFCTSAAPGSPPKSPRGLADFRFAMIARALQDVAKLFQDPNSPCGQFFGPAGLDALSTIFNNISSENIVPVQSVQNPNVGIQQSGAQTIHNTPNGTFRTFGSLGFNGWGPFFFPRNPSGGGAFPTYGGYAAGSRQADILMILHELAHDIRGSDGNWLIPDDGGNPSQSDRNSQKIRDACGARLTRS